MIQITAFYDIVPTNLNILTFNNYSNFKIKLIKSGNMNYINKNHLKLT